MKTTALWLMGCLACVLWSGLAQGDSAKTNLTGLLAERFNAISDRLVCQCSCKMILRVCNHQNCPSGVPMRDEIEAKLLGGNSDDQIVGGFLTRFGTGVLSAPSSEGAWRLVWLMPFLALIVGGGFLVRWVKRQRGKKDSPWE